jgi:hypothetical protein
MGVKGHRQGLHPTLRRRASGFLEYFRPNFEEDHHNFAGIEIQAKMS